MRVQAHQGVAQPPDQDYIRVAGALSGGLARGDIRAVQHPVAEVGEPAERLLLDSGLGDGERHVTGPGQIATASSANSRARASISAAVQFGCLPISLVMAKLLT